MTVPLGFALLNQAATQRRIAGQYLHEASEPVLGDLSARRHVQALSEWSRLKRDARRALDWAARCPSPRLP